MTTSISQEMHFCVSMTTVDAFDDSITTGIAPVIIVIFIIFSIWAITLGIIANSIISQIHRVNLKLNSPVIKEINRESEFQFFCG